MGDDETKRFLLEHYPNSCGVTQISRGTGRPKSTVHSHLTSLLKRGEIVKVSGGKYLIAPTVDFFERFAVVRRTSFRSARVALNLLGRVSVLASCAFFLGALSIMQTTGLVSLAFPVYHLTVGLYGLTVLTLFVASPAILLRMLVGMFRGFAT